MEPEIIETVEVADVTPDFALKLRHAVVIEIVTTLVGAVILVGLKHLSVKVVKRYKARKSSSDIIETTATEA